MKTETKIAEPTPRPRRARLVVFGVLWLILATGVAVIYLTFAWFVNPVTADPETVAPADAVVLFAGVEDRLDVALDLMERGVAPNLVLPNGPEIDDADGLCDAAVGFTVFCPPTDEASTIGEARSIGRLAEEQGWSRLVAVTSVYHVHRATYLLDRCHDGPIVAVAPDQSLDRDEVIEKGLEEWTAYLGSVILQPAC